MNASNEIPIWEPLPGSRTICKVFMHLFSHYSVTGLENIPQRPYLVTFNHESYWDSPAIGSQFKDTVPTFTARKYKGTLVGLLLHVGSPVWIDQESADRQALTTALKIMQQGSPFAIAPEGTRSKSGKLLEGHEGVAFIATRANVPIVPVAVIGTNLMFKQVRPEVCVTVGKPYKLPEGRARGDQLAAYTDRIMCAIAALMPEQYHGYYTGNPLIAEMAKVVR
ncbi:MAG: lysophospholipid acyltransferase family protein [Chloroflexota bacterium]